MKIVFYPCLLALFILFAVPAFGMTVYKWTDSQGVINLTDDPKNVPAESQGRVQKEVYQDTSTEVAALPPQSGFQKMERPKTDIYGLGESWWKDRVRPWKARLREATENYDRVNQKFVEEAEDLIRYKYGSRTQVKSRVLQMDRANDERQKYLDEIEEASQMLNKLAKEASEAKADPLWLQ